MNKDDDDDDRRLHDTVTRRQNVNRGKLATMRRFRAPAAAAANSLGIGIGHHAADHSCFLFRCDSPHQLIR